MTLEEFKALRLMEDHRVHMVFSDGMELTATLTSIQVDIDESRHLVYEKVASSPRHPELGAGPYYSPGEELVSCSPVDDV